MKLSEAIRLGAMLKPQGRGNESLAGDATCALGAACDAVGVVGNWMERFSVTSVLWPWVIQQKQSCPICGPDDRYNSTRSVIWHLNDSHRWTREAIADWLEPIETQHATTQETPQPVTVEA